MACHPVYNNDGVVKVHESAGALGFEVAPFRSIGETPFAMPDQGSCSCANLTVEASSSTTHRYGLPEMQATMILASNSRTFSGGRVPTQAIELPSRVLTG